MTKISEVRGTITLSDGTTSEYSIFTDGGWQQWGATTERLGQTVDALEAMSRALKEDDLIVSDSDEEVPESADCANCGERIEPDDGGAIWYHADTSSAFCDPEGEEDLTRQAEPKKEG